MNAKGIIISATLICAAILPISATSKKPARRPAASSGPGATELLIRAREAYRDYDISEAERMLSQARNKRPDELTRDDIDRMEQEVTIARNSLDRIERLVILDSISVAKDDFLSRYRLPVSAGKISDGGDDDSATGYMYTSESGDYRLWAAPDSLTGQQVIYESSQLMDKSWTAPHALTSLSQNGDAAYPFMMPDGITLYYALTGPESMGGYDLMIATRDGVDGDFMQPQNLGMPYNSPGNDYMMAVDEERGIGWFATDRDAPEGMTTVYVYKLNDLRNNYDPEEEDDLESLARLRDWRSTQGDEDYSALLEEIDNIPAGNDDEEAEFHLPMPAGRVYTSYDDFQSVRARDLMESYVDDLDSYNDLSDQISDLRRQYHSHPSQSMKQRISGLEKQQAASRRALRKKLSDIYKAEK